MGVTLLQVRNHTFSLFTSKGGRVTTHTLSLTLTALIVTRLLLQWTPAPSIQLLKEKGGPSVSLLQAALPSYVVRGLHASTLARLREHASGDGQLSILAASSTAAERRLSEALAAPLLRFRLVDAGGRITSAAAKGGIADAGGRIGSAAAKGNGKGVVTEESKGKGSQGKGKVVTPEAAKEGKGKEKAVTAPEWGECLKCAPRRPPEIWVEQRRVYDTEQVRGTRLTLTTYLSPLLLSPLLLLIPNPS